MASLSDFALFRLDPVVPALRGWSIGAASVLHVGAGLLSQIHPRNKGDASWREGIPAVPGGGCHENAPRATPRWNSEILERETGFEPATVSLKRRKGRQK